MQRLLFVLAWADCREASFLVAAGEPGRAAEKVMGAVEKLSEGARLPRRQRPRWRPIVRLGEP